MKTYEPDVENVVLPDHIKMIRCTDCQRDLPRDYIAQHILDLELRSQFFICRDCASGKAAVCEA